MTRYELWSYESGNRIASEQTLDAVVSLLRGIRDANPGYDYWQHWGIAETDGTEDGRTWMDEELKALVEA